MAHLPVPPPSPCTPIIVKVDEQVLGDGDISFQLIRLVVLNPLVDGESGGSREPFSDLKDVLLPETLKVRLTVKPFKLTSTAAVQKEVLSFLLGLAKPYDPESISTRALLVRARTSTGKTLAYLVPIIEARVRAAENSGQKEGFGRWSALQASSYWTGGEELNVKGNSWCLMKSTHSQILVSVTIFLGPASDTRTSNPIPLRYTPANQQVAREALVKDHKSINCVDDPTPTHLSGVPKYANTVPSPSLQQSTSLYIPMDLNSVKTASVLETSLMVCFVFPHSQVHNGVPVTATVSGKTIYIEHHGVLVLAAQLVFVIESSLKFYLQRYIHEKGVHGFDVAISSPAPFALTEVATVSAHNVSITNTGNR
ncbi:hypothetical protein ARMSODRAFT_1026626 [Armillaria solidipes]|uniref:DEAD/DEAH box helicase domain-containing protein n=1 Tax=Armillaria solidipes TaxID=1076256 RepID=A0A2H3B923_9AGAR|nr:hypothetical protein ARMSODRAFT_1026626 [Armillaria solidipes]